MEKNRIFTFDSHQRLKKMLLIFRASLLLMAITATTLQANASAQTGKVTVKMEDATIDEMIKNVRTETNYRFLYRVEEVNKFGKRNINLKDASIEEFLRTVLAGTNLSYVIESDVIIIRPVTDDKKEVEKPRVIKGKVVDEKGMTLPGATVMIKGTKLGIVTDIDGKFKLEIPKMDSVILIVSFVGYETHNVRLSNDTKNDEKELVVKLKEDVKQMEEVVITGYANIRKESFTGSSVTVTKEDLLKVSKTNVIKALQTFDPSFRIKENNRWGSDPNAMPEVYIRGESGIGIKDLDKDKLSKSSLDKNPNLPTFIMDGFEISVTKLYDFDPNRIESITILKDAAATALYGSRAANGVVVITTVAPKPGKLNVSYNMTGEISMPDLTDYNLLNASEKLEVEKRAGLYVAEDGDPMDQYSYNREYYDKLGSIKKGVDTYWLSQPLHTAFNHKHSLYIDGGSETIRFGIEASYYNEDGVMIESCRDRWGAGFYLDYRIGKLQVKNHITYNVTKQEESPYGSFSDYTKQKPYDVYKDEHGKYLEYLKDWEDGDLNSTENPLYEATLGNFDKATTEELINNLSLNWYMNDFLQLKGQFSVTRQMTSSEKFYDPRSKKNAEPLSVSTNLSSGELRTNDGNGLTWDMNAFLAYNRSILKHNINFTLGINAKSTSNESIAALYKGFPSGVLHSPNYAQKIDSKPTRTESTSKLFGALFTLNYSYNNIYLFDASCRLDGSSEFGSDNKFAPFWSLGTGINIHNYKFMDNYKYIDILKIRGTYGQTGKVNFPSYAAVTTYEMLTDEWYKTGYGATLQALGNKKLTWETTNTFDIGFEVSFLNRLIYLEATYYNKQTVDLINSVTIPSSTGFTTYVDNIGEVRNRGYEFNLRSDIIRKKDLYVALYANLAHNENKIMKISESLKEYNDRVDAFFKDIRNNESKSEPQKKYVEGGSLNSIFGVQSLGINPASGEEIFLRPDGTTTDVWVTTDQVVIGNTEPEIQGSFGFNITYKNFSLYTTFMYECGGQRYNQTLVDKVENADVYKENVDKRVLTDRWQKEGDIAKYKKLKTSRNGNVGTTNPTSRFVQDYNVLSLNSLTLGYDFNMEKIKRIGLSMLRFEIGANDLFRCSSVEEERGLSYPFARTMNFSLKASF